MDETNLEILVGFIAGAIKQRRCLSEGLLQHSITCNYQHPSCLKCNCGIADIVTALGNFEKLNCDTIKID